MSKLQKDTHVHIPCPACGKTERVKLKWAQKHKSLKCSKCKETVDLRANPAKSFSPCPRSTSAAWPIATRACYSAVPQS